MTRRAAAVVIGVDRTGGLQPLNSASAGAREFADLLQREGFDVSLHTDDAVDPATGERLPVTVAQVKAAFTRFVTAPPRYHLLVVYFSGHGYQQTRADAWLLSGAPVDPGEAINLRTSEDLARYSGIPNVVFISDACRSQPDSRSGGLVQPVAVLPNFGEVATLSKIDLFKATSYALPAYEVNIDGRPLSVLTAALIAAFHEPGSDMVLEVDAGGQVIRVVPNRKLEHYLQPKVNALLRDAAVGVEQLLDITVPSSDETYIARVQPRPGGGTSAGRAGGGPGGVMAPVPMPAAVPAVPASPAAPTPAAPAPSAPAAPSFTPTISVGFNSGELVLRSLSTRNLVSAFGAGSLLDAADQPTRRAAQLRLPQRPAQPLEFDTGVIVAGAAIAEAIAVPLSPGIYPGHALLDAGDGESQPAILRVDAEQPASLLVRTHDGRCVVLAILPRFIAHATFDAKGLADVSYQPSSLHLQQSIPAHQLRAADELRALVALAVDENRLKLRSNRDALSLMRRVMADETLDPTLGLYAAQALHQAGNEAMLRDLVQLMRRQLQADLFDLRLLASRRFEAAIDVPLVPFCPMLTQSWNLLAARDAQLPPALHEAGRYLADSLWLTFEPDAVDLLYRAVALQPTMESG